MAEKKKLTLHERMAAVMRDVSYVQKGDKRVNNQYTFVSHDAVCAAIRPALVEHGILCMPSLETWFQEGNRTAATYVVSFVNVDDPNDTIEVRAFGYGIDSQDKGPGKACSYAVKYALLKVFCLETGDDPERDLIDYQPPAAAPESKPEPKKERQATPLKAAVETPLTQGSHAGTRIKDLKGDRKAKLKILENYKAKYHESLDISEKSAISLVLEHFRGEFEEENEEEKRSVA